MKKIILLIILLIGFNSFGQNETYYYYNGQKINLKIDTKRISINSTNNTNVNNIKSIVNNSGQTSYIELKDKTNLNSLQLNSAPAILPNHYLEISFDNEIPSNLYISKINQCNSVDGVIKASPCFKTKEGQLLGLSNNIYVKLKSINDIKNLEIFAASKGAIVLGNNPYLPLWFTISLPKYCPQNSLQLANIFFESNLFESAEPEFIYHNLQTSADPYFNNQWYLKNTGQYGNTYAGIDINAEQAWTLSKGDGIKTAVFDHGFDMSHPDLINNTLGTGYDAQTASSPSILRGAHGTACAGIMGAQQNNNKGISGVAPNAKLVSISISLTWGDTPQMLANGFNWATVNGIDVISNSWGGYAPSSFIDNAIDNALTNGRNGKGMVVVFAAGNENDTNPRYPGNSNPKILVVGAMSPCGERKSETSCDNESFWGSCYGDKIDVVAPGVKMYTTDIVRSDGYTTTDYIPDFNGTSSACPVVAGIATLVLSKNPNLTGQEVNNIIERSARKVRTDLYNYTTEIGRPNGTRHLEMGYGLADAYNALLQTPSPCQLNLTINTPITTSHNYQVNNQIIASSIVNNNLTIYFKAKSIVLKPGFKVSGNATGKFKAHYDPCMLSRISDTEINSNTDIASSYINENEGEKISNLNYQIFPNPNNGAFTIQFENSNINLVEIYNLTGQKIFEKQFENINYAEINLDINTKGIYLVKGTSNGVTKTYKMIIK